MTEYGRIHTDGSRSGGQPKQSNIFEACDVQKHTLIVEQDYASHTVKVKSLDDSQPTQSDALLDAEGVKLYWYRQGKDDGVEQERAKIVAWLRKEAIMSTDTVRRRMNKALDQIEAGEHLK